MEARTYVFQNRGGDARLYVTVNEKEQPVGMFFGSLTTMAARRRQAIRDRIVGAKSLEELARVLVAWEVVDVFEGNGQLPLIPQNAPGPVLTTSPPTSSTRTLLRSRRHDHLGT